MQHRLAGHRAHVLGLGQRRVLVHHLGQQILVERAPVGADAHRLAILDRFFDDGAELDVALLLEADVAGIDAVFVERLGAGRMIGEKLVADVVEVADQRHVAADAGEPLLDPGYGGSRLVAVDRDAHQLGAGAREAGDLADGAVDVGGVGVGHRLHDDRSAAADDDGAFALADGDGDGVMALERTGDHRVIGFEGRTGHGEPRDAERGRLAREIPHRSPGRKAEPNAGGESRPRRRALVTGRGRAAARGSIAGRSESLHRGVLDQRLIPQLRHLVYRDGAAACAM